MTPEERTAQETRLQNACNTWVQILGLQYWTVVIKVVDVDEEMTVYKRFSTAVIPITSLEGWQAQYPDLPYDTEETLVANLIRLSLYGDASSVNILTVNYMAHVYVSMTRSINRLQNQIFNMNASEPEPDQNETTSEEPTLESEEETYAIE